MGHSPIRPQRTAPKGSSGRGPSVCPKRVEGEVLHEAESTVGAKRIPAARCNLACMRASAIAKMDAALTEGYKSVAFSRIKDAQSFVDRVTTEVEAAEASPSYEVTSKRRKRPN